MLIVTPENPRPPQRHPGESDVDWLLRLQEQAASQHTIWQQRLRQGDPEAVDDAMSAFIARSTVGLPIDMLHTDDPMPAGLVPDLTEALDINRQFRADVLAGDPVATDRYVQHELNQRIFDDTGNLLPPQVGN